MDIDRSQRPIDLPPPPSADEVAAQMAVPLLTLVNQETVEEASAGRGFQTQDGVLLVEYADLSYTLWRHPADHGDPRNLEDLSPEVKAGLEAEPVGPLPDWLLEARTRLRYPMIWEGVRTTHFFQGVPRAPEEVLAEHMNYIITNVFRDERVAGGFPGELMDPVEANDAQSGHLIVIDGKETGGVRIDTDPHVLGLGIAIDSRVHTAAIPRRYLPYLRLEFATRPTPST